MSSTERCMAYCLLAALLVVFLATKSAEAGGCPPKPIECDPHRLGEMRWGKRTPSDFLRNDASQMVRPRRTYSESQLSSPKYRFRELLRRFTRNEEH